MMQISSTFRAPALLSPRTENYVAALIRQGDNFDYYKWLQRARGEEAQATQVAATFGSGEIIAAEIGNPINLPGFRGAFPNCAFMTRAAPLPSATYRSHHQIRNKPPQAGLRGQLDKVADAWDDFQANRARDAMYGYLGASLWLSEGLQHLGSRSILRVPANINLRARASNLRIWWRVHCIPPTDDGYP
jgi:hypothetical protein